MRAAQRVRDRTWALRPRSRSALTTETVAPSYHSTTRHEQASDIDDISFRVLAFCATAVGIASSTGWMS